MITIQRDWSELVISPVEVEKTKRLSFSVGNIHEGETVELLKAEVELVAKRLLEWVDTGRLEDFEVYDNR